MVETAPSRRPSRFCLCGELAGTPIFRPLVEGPNLIGSDPGSHVLLPTEGISRRHAVLDVELPYLRIIDQESKNGTWVNGVRISNARLRLGDEITLGAVKLRLEAVDGDDLELALSLAEPEGPGDEPALPVGETTTLGHRSAQRFLHHWLSLSCSFLDRLEGAGGNRGASALAVVTDRLGARGACLVEVGEGGEPALQALFGEVDTALLESLASCWGNRSGDPPGAGAEPFVTKPEVTGLVTEGEGGALALLVMGDFPGRGASRPLFATLLHHYLRAVRAVGEPAEAAPGAEATLRWPPGFVRGLSPAMEELYEAMRPLVAADLPVLVTGETGTGKELVARALHLSSPRSPSPFVAINCAAIPADLLEAELFGIGQGVASGVRSRLGKFQEAGEGTLFLDEVSSMPAELQSKLLRVLQEREIQPLGAPPVPLRARLVAATNVAAPALEASETFRSDLFYRLAGATLHLPPLRHRPSDIPLLVDGLLRSITRDLGKELRGVSVGAMNRLVAHAWPGNVRELEHELRRLAHLCPEGRPIVSTMLAGRLRGEGGDGELPPDLSETVPGTAVASISFAPVSSPSLPTLELSALEELAVSQALEQAGGSQGKAAELLGISRFALRRRLSKRGS